MLVPNYKNAKIFHADFNEYLNSGIYTVLPADGEVNTLT
jgi:hypothetical protein